MSWTRLGLIVLAISTTAAFFVWTRKADTVGEHRRVRQIILHYTLSRVDDPVIVLGDSITEASTLPRSICGHAIVNAGLDGASTASDLGNWLAPVLGNKRAAMIVVALGTNDALATAASRQNFEDRYGALLMQLSKLTPRLAVLGIPPVEVQGRMTIEMQNETMTTINNYNSIMSDIARRSDAIFLPLSAMPKPSTIDGVHLSAAGYQIWDKAILQAAEGICS